jgi:peptidoglycan/xylan/chitin deacetylase (PgdA/CDA1 family)
VAPAITTDIAAVTAALSLGAGTWWYAAMWPESQLFGRALIAGKNPNQIALTFDDGPNEEATPILLDVLARHGVSATFFVIGKFARQRPELVRELLAAGHLVGNHTMTHPPLVTQSAAVIRRELADCNAAIEDVTGGPIRFFRPPFGARRPVVLRAARELDLTPVLWNVSGTDWNPIGVDAILENLEFGLERNRRRKRGSNILLHDGGHLQMGARRLDTVRAVDRLLTGQQGKGTEFVRLDAWDT